MRYEVGSPLAMRQIDFVSPETMKTWAPILRDPNPIHLDRAVVKAKGLGDRLINQGPINLGYIIDMLHMTFPGGTIEKLSNRFVDNVYEGDRLEASGIITGVEQANGVWKIACDFQLKAAERDLVITGKAIVAVP